MTHLERFLALMEYKPVDRLPNWEVGVWAQTAERWHAEGLNKNSVHWDFFTGSPEFQMDPREYIPLNTGMIPAFPVEVISGMTATKPSETPTVSSPGLCGKVRSAEHACAWMNTSPFP